MPLSLLVRGPFYPLVFILLDFAMLRYFSLILFVANANAFQDGSSDFYASQEPTLP